MEITHIVAALQEERKRIDQAITALTGITHSTNHKPARKRRGMSAAGRARIAAAQKARWAKLKRSKIKRVK
jgi:hypothetical protein